MLLCIVEKVKSIDWLRNSRPKVIGEVNGHQFINDHGYKTLTFENQETNLHMQSKDSMHP